MLQKESCTPIRKKIFLVILSFTVIPSIIISLLVFVSILDSKVEHKIGYYREALNNSTNDVANIYLAYIEKMNYLTTNYQIYRYLGTDRVEDVYTNLAFQQQIRSIFEAVQTTGSIYSRIFIYAYKESIMSGNYIKKIDELINNPDINDDIKDRVLNLTKNLYNSGNVTWEYMVLPEREMEKIEFICLYRKVVSIYNKPIYIIEVRIPLKEIAEQYLCDIPEGSFIVYLTDNQRNRIILNKNKIEKDEALSILDRYLISGNDESFFVTETSIDINDHKVILFIPKSYINNDIISLITVFLLIFFLFVSLVVFAIRAVSFYLTKQLIDMLVKMSMNIDKFIHDEQLLMPSNDDEFFRIKIKIYELVKRIKEAYRQLSEYEKEKKELELNNALLEVELLQERINPHFLYNTLSVLRIAFPDKKLTQVVNSLVRYYRIALSRGENTIPVYKELEMIEEYLKIQKFAYEADFRYIIDVDERLKNQFILKNLLQPIVENAFIHGINGLEADGCIQITGRLKDKEMIFKIKDNGVGIPKSKMSQLLLYDNNTVTNTNGYGLINVKKRIETFYGEDYGLHIQSQVGVGTEVTINLPVECTDFV